MRPGAVGAADALPHGHDLGRSGRVREPPHAEGEAERESFKNFCELVLKAQPGVLQTIINRPIYPSNVPHLR